VWAGFLSPARPERELFPGLVVTALALVAVAAGLTALIRKRQAGPGETAGVTMVYGTILLGAVWLSFGPSVPGPYRWLVAWLPGFDGLRVPARIVAVVSLALAVLAGGAVAWASRRLRPLLGALVAAGVSGLVLVEGYAGPMPLAPFDAGQLHRRDLNAWLREAPPGGVLELPVAGPGFEPFTMEYQFNTLFHRHPIVNGYSGTGYALQDFLAGAASPLEDEREVAPMLRGLRELGVRYVVLHRSLYLPRQGEDATRILEQAIDGEGEQLASRARFGEAIAWRLADAPPANETRPPSGTAIPAASLRVSASSAPQTAALAADGNVATRWTSGRAQAGTEWLRVDLPSETDVGQIVLRTVREGHSDRPRRLRVEVQDGAGAGHVLFESSILTETIRSIAHGGSLAPVVIDLPPNRSRAVTLRQTGQASYWYWSVHELELRERPR
jgi:hypothetical protein